MRAVTRAALRFTSISALGLASCFARSAGAQPNPFDDYERYTASGPSAAPPVAPVAPAASGPALRAAAMGWSLGLRSQLSFSRLTYDRVGDAPDGAAMALLFRLSPALHLFVHDRIQVGLSAGLMARAGGNNLGDDSSDGNMLIEATGQYFAPMSGRVAFVPGVGLGGFFGAGKRATGVETVGGVAGRVDRASTTAGMSLAVYLGIAYQIDHHLQLRSGLSATAFFGSDSVEGQRSPLGNTATHIGLPVEIFYTF